MSKTLSVTRNKDGDVDLRDIVVSADGKSCSVEQMLEAWVMCRQQIADKDAEIADGKRQLEEARSALTIAMAALERYAVEPDSYGSEPAASALNDIRLIVG